MLLLRSILFNVVFYLANAAQMIFWIPAFFIIAREDAWKIVRMWAYSLLWLQYAICGSRYDFRGLSNIPRGSALVAAKHQSAWETYTLCLFLEDASFILKRELGHVPVFGWYMRRMKVVPVDRGKGGKALASMTVEARKQLDELDRQIIIYPEGTRMRAGAPPRYKYGVTHLYEKLGIPVLPVAVNSGLYWGRRSLIVHPGTIIMEFLGPVAPGLPKEEFANRLETDIEEASNRLIAEAARSDQAPPLALEIMAERAGVPAG